METTKSTRLENLKDPRQSPEWGKMLEFYGWKIFHTSTGVMIAVKKVLLWSVVKIQRPHELAEKDLSEIETICKKEKALFVKIESYIYQDEAPLKKFGYEISTFPMCPTKTMFIDLNIESDELWNRVSHSGKYSINRARREGAKLYFYRNPSEEKLKEYFEVLEFTGKLKHFYVEPYKYLLNKKTCFGNESFLILVFGKTGELEGGKFFCAYDGNVLYVTGGTSAKGRKAKSGYLLTWEALLYFKRLGYKNMDLEGLYDSRFPTFSQGWEGFSHFKDKFNGEVIELPKPHIKYLSKIMHKLSLVSPIGM